MLSLCRLDLKFLNIGKVVGNIVSNNYGDEELLVVTRHLHSLQKFWVSKNELGWEGVGTVANNLTTLEMFGVNDCKEIGQGANLLGRLSVLEELYASTHEYMQLILG